MAGGISFQTQRAINEMDRSLSPHGQDLVAPPAISNHYVRPPGVQPMSDQQSAKLRELQLRRAAEVKALRAGTRDQ